MVVGPLVHGTALVVGPLHWCNDRCSLYSNATPSVITLATLALSDMPANYLTDVGRRVVNGYR